MINSVRVCKFTFRYIKFLAPTIEVTVAKNHSFSKHVIPVPVFKAGPNTGIGEHFVIECISYKK